MSGSDETYTVAGAGPAGLATAITLARSGCRVVVNEARPDVGWRFMGDFQGLENWTTTADVLDVLHDIGITTDFNKFPCFSGTAFDAWGHAHPIRSEKALFYLVERGPGSGSLDRALLRQARDSGVDVRFNKRVRQLSGSGVLAIGPRSADAIAVGYHFETDMQDGFWVICDNRLAPGGYAYLLIWNGRGLVKSCMFTDFKHQRQYVARTVAGFQRLLGLTMRDLRPHGGVGNFHIPECAYSGGHPIAGEQAGFQDVLWGFGMRHAVTSGVLAARSLLQDVDYNLAWRQAFGDQMDASVVNRALFSLLGNRGYRRLLRKQLHHGDARGFLRALYANTWYKRCLLPWARYRALGPQHDEQCKRVECNCVWCRCGGMATPLGHLR